MTRLLETSANVAFASPEAMTITRAAAADGAASATAMTGMRARRSIQTAATRRGRRRLRSITVDNRLRSAAVQEVLRDGLLAGSTVLAAPGSSMTAACARIGAEIRTLDTDLLDEDATAAAVGPCAALVVDAAALFGDGGP